MKKLIVLRGLPGSGKTTLARTLVGIDTVRVNKDAIRETLHFGGIKLEHEELVHEIEASMVRQALRRGYNVVVDDTNLGNMELSKWNQLAYNHDAEMIVQEVTTSLRTSINRYYKREKGKSWLKKFAFIAIALMALRKVTKI